MYSHRVMFLGPEKHRSILIHIMKVVFDVSLYKYGQYLQNGISSIKKK